MMKIIRADTYRIVRGKGPYITLAVLIAVIFLQILGGINMNAGANANSMDMINTDPENFDVENFDIASLFHSPTGSEAPFQIMSGSSNLLCFLLPLIVFIGATDFNTGAARNTLSGGISRAKYYCSKLVLSCISCALLLIAYVLLSIILATALNGFGGKFSGEFVSNVLKIFLPQLWLCLAGACVGNFFVFTFKRTAAVIGIGIGFILVPSILILILSFISDRFGELFKYELTSNIDMMTRINSMSAGEIARTLAVGAGYIAVSVVGGFLLFKKSEIK
ncbi:MAG: hypothetical protein LBH28_10945 [Oscillospiraceae bacterium]|jgi:ABC-2 type transport system permease protein|nr:hypothetical protein [Oscillospiraceae bacterium]